mmetsp:Transcript_29438/g.100105  ORF Transcript_29438/g.100105 Transcript_29438/m.100105 type:complete len:209 (-) Transcript_29438:406-1032(-)
MPWLEAIFCTSRPRSSAGRLPDTRPGAWTRRSCASAKLRSSLPQARSARSFVWWIRHRGPSSARSCSRSFGEKLQTPMRDVTPPSARPWSARQAATSAGDRTSLRRASFDGPRRRSAPAWRIPMARSPWRTARVTRSAAPCAASSADGASTPFFGADTWCTLTCTKKPSDGFRSGMDATALRSASPTPRKRMTMKVMVLFLRATHRSR